MEAAGWTTVPINLAAVIVATASPLTAFRTARENEVSGSGEEPSRAACDPAFKLEWLSENDPVTTVTRDGFDCDLRDSSAKSSETCVQNEYFSKNCMWTPTPFYPNGQCVARQPPIKCGDLDKCSACLNHMYEYPFDGPAGSFLMNTLKCDTRAIMGFGRAMGLQVTVDDDDDGSIGQLYYREGNTVDTLIEMCKDEHLPVSEAKPLAHMTNCTKVGFELLHRMTGLDVITVTGPHYGMLYGVNAAKMMTGSEEVTEMRKDLIDLLNAMLLPQIHGLVGRTVGAIHKHGCDDEWFEEKTEDVKDFPIRLSVAQLQADLYVEGPAKCSSFANSNEFCQRFVPFLHDSEHVDSSMIFSCAEDCIDGSADYDETLVSVTVTLLNTVPYASRTPFMRRPAERVALRKHVKQFFTFKGYDGTVATVFEVDLKEVLDDVTIPKQACAVVTDQGVESSGCFPEVEGGIPFKQLMPEMDNTDKQYFKFLTGSYRTTTAAPKAGSNLAATGAIFLFGTLAIVAGALTVYRWRYQVQRSKTSETPLLAEHKEVSEDLSEF
jgi:hypothetical protein